MTPTSGYSCTTLADITTTSCYCYHYRNKAPQEEKPRGASVCLPGRGCGGPLPSPPPLPPPMARARGQSLEQINLKNMLINTISCSVLVAEDIQYKYMYCRNCNIKPAIYYHLYIRIYLFVMLFNCEFIIFSPLAMQLNVKF